MGECVRVQACTLPDKLRIGAETCKHATTRCVDLPGRCHRVRAAWPGRLGGRWVCEWVCMRMQAGMPKCSELVAENWLSQHSVPVP